MKRKIWPYLALALLGCGSTSQPPTNDSANPPMSPTQSTTTPCTGTLDGTVTGTFTCDHDGEPLALKSASSDVTAFLLDDKTLSASFSAVTLDFEIPGTPKQQSYTGSTLKSVQINVITTEMAKYAVRITTPPDVTNQGDVTLTLASVRYDMAGNAYYLHGSLDATLPILDPLDPSAKSVKMHVDF